MLLDHVVRIARHAGAEVMRIYDREDFAIETKADRSPLTEADRAAHELIVGELRRLTPRVPVWSEESAAVPFDVRKGWREFWLVDPLDGTKEFIKRNGEFTVNIALIEDGRPTAGVVYAPDLDWLYYGAEGRGAFKVEGGGEPRLLEPSGPASPGKLTIVGSRSHPTPEMEAFVEEQRKTHGDVEFIAMGSSLKLCVIAEGKADLSPRFGPTMEWDTAAADAVVRAAGRRVTKHDSDEDLPYNKENLLNGWFVAR